MLDVLGGIVGIVVFFGVLIVWPLKLAKIAEAHGRSFATWCLLGFIFPGRTVMSIVLYFSVIRKAKNNYESIQCSA